MYIHVQRRIVVPRMRLAIWERLVGNLGWCYYEAYPTNDACTIIDRKSRYHMADKNDKHPFIYCFLDTNVLYHFQAFDEIRWPEILNAKQVCLVFVPTVLHELNRHKDDSTNERRRNRARMLLSKLKKLLEPETITDQLPLVRPNVVLLAIAQEPLMNWTEEHLDPSSGDDRLIASILEFSRQHPSESFLLLTDDFPLRLKARNHNIQAVSPEGMVPSIKSPSPEEARRQKLLKNVAALVPGVNISFYRDMFGNPLFINSDEEKKTKEYVFVTSSFYLDAVTNTNDMVQCFSLTIRDKTFNPVFKSPDYPVNKTSFQITLGVSTLSDVPGSPEYLVGRLGAHDYSYYETRYLGNPGLYECFGFGLNQAGYLPENAGLYLSVLANNPRYDHRSVPKQVLTSLGDLRTRIAFNTYAVSALGVAIQDFAGTNLGVNYYQVRTLNT